MNKSSPAPKKASPKKSSPKPAIAAPSRTDEQKWQAEDDVRTLQRAEEIRADKARLARAKTVARKQVAAISKVAK